MHSVTVRKAERKDLEAMLRIYNYEVLNGVATFDIKPKTIEEWEEWFLAHTEGNRSVYAAELEGTVIGYASLSEYRDRAAFDSTVELSVYVDPLFRRQGAAKQLMECVIEAARQDENTHLIVSVITSENIASIRLHEAFGFTYCGTLREVGYKFGQYRSVDHYTLAV